MRVRANALDLEIYRRVRSLARTPSTIRLARRYSALGEHGIGWVAVGAAGAILDDHRRGRWLRSTLVVAAAYMTSTTIKVAIGRQRPVIETLPQLMRTPTGLSFPSSHSTSSFAAARAYQGVLPTVPLYMAACAMAFSRMYLGVHYPSDIAAGAALGTLLGGLAR